MISVMEAQLSDADAITQIKTAAFNKEINTYLGRNGGPPGYDQIESEEEIINKFKAYKIMLDSVIIGAFFLIPVNENQARFEDFVIKPEYQGNGYGTKTLQILEEMHPDITAWYLSTPVFSIGNQHLYEKCGYKEIDRNKEEIEYCKQLK